MKKKSIQTTTPHLSPCKNKTELLVVTMLPQKKNKLARNKFGLESGKWFTPKDTACNGLQYTD